MIDGFLLVEQVDGNWHNVKPAWYFLKPCLRYLNLVAEWHNGDAPRFASNFLQIAAAEYGLTQR